LQKSFKKKKIDIIFFAKLDPIYVIAAFLAKIPIRVGDGNQLLMNPLLTHKVLISWHDFTKHEIVQQLRLLEPFTTDLEIEKVKFKKNDQLKDRVLKLVDLQSTNDFIIIHPTFGKGNRGWGVTNYSDLIDLIHTKTHYKVILSGGIQDKVTTDTIVQKANTPIINISGKTSLDELLYIVQNCKLAIGAETGPLHMAAIAQCPVISISPTKYTSSFRWGPLTTNHVIIKDNNNCNLVCNTYKQQCTKDYCIDTIVVTDVFKAVQFLLTQTSFPQNRLYYWFKTNATVALHIEHLSKQVESNLESISTLLIQNNINMFVSTTSPETKAYLDNKNIANFYRQKLDINSWAVHFAKHNVVVWHALSSQSGRWHWVVQNLISLKIDKQPIFMVNNSIFSSIKDLLDYYISCSQKLSKSAKVLK